MPAAVRCWVEGGFSARERPNLAFSLGEARRYFRVFATRFGIAKFGVAKAWKLVGQTKLILAAHAFFGAWGSRPMGIARHTLVLVWLLPLPPRLEKAGFQRPTIAHRPSPTATRGPEVAPQQTEHRRLATGNRHFQWGRQVWGTSQALSAIKLMRCEAVHASPWHAPLSPASTSRPSPSSPTNSNLTTTLAPVPARHFLFPPPCRKPDRSHVASQPLSLAPASFPWSARHQTWWFASELLPLATPASHPSRHRSASLRKREPLTFHVVGATFLASYSNRAAISKEASIGTTIRYPPQAVTRLVRRIAGCILPRNVQRSSASRIENVPSIETSTSSTKGESLSARIRIPNPNPE